MAYIMLTDLSKEILHSTAYFATARLWGRKLELHTTAKDPARTELVLTRERLSIAPVCTFCLSPVDEPRLRQVRFRTGALRYGDAAFCCLVISSEMQGRFRRPPLQVVHTLHSYR